MTRRYNYTPRRSGRTGRPVQRPEDTRGFPLFPVLLALVLIIGVVWFTTRGGDSSTTPGGQVLALAESPISTLNANASPQATPRRTPGQEAAPRITAYAASLIEEPCGEQLFGLNQHLRLPPASLTKIVTAIVAAEHGDLDQQIDITIDGGALSLQTDSTVMGLAPGQRLSLKDLIAGLMLRSGADAAVTIANAIGGNERVFAGMMNAKVEELGLNKSHFVNAHGLEHPDQRISSYDAAMLGGELLRIPALAEIVGTQTYQPNWGGGVLENINLLLANYSGAIGVKTGYTDEAGPTIVGAAERDGRRLIVSLLHSQDLYVDAANLLDWGFENTEPACEATAVAAP